MHNGKDIQPFSWFGSAEGELLLSPNMEFVVTKKPHTHEGFTYVELTQIPNDTLYS